jgi:hypothetical protein
MIREIFLLERARGAEAEKAAGAVLLSPDQLDAIAGLRKALAGAQEDTQQLVEIGFSDYVKAFAETFGVTLPEEVRKGGVLIVEVWDEVLGLLRAKLSELLPADAVDAILEQLGSLAGLTLGKPAKDFKEQLQSQLDSLLDLSAEGQLRAFEKIKERAALLYGEEIPEDVAQMMDLIEKLLKRDVAAEGIGKAIDDIIESAERQLAEIEITGGEQEVAATEEVRQRTIEQLEELKARSLEVAKTEEERQVIEEKIGEAILDQRKGLAALETLEERLKRKALRRLNTQLDIIRKLKEAVDGTAEFARAMGLVDEETQKIIESLAEMSQGISTMIAGLQNIQAGAGAVGAVIAGGMGLLTGLGGVFGSGEPSEEQQERMRVLEANNKALKELKQAVEDLAGQFKIAGADFASALKIFAEYEEYLRWMQQVGGAGGVGGGGFRTMDFEEWARLQGYSIEELAKLGESLPEPIKILDEAGRIIPGSLEQLAEALRALEADFIRFPDTIEGIGRKLQTEFELFDVTDPIEQFRRWREELMKAEFDPTVVQNYRDTISQLQAEAARIQSELTAETDPARRAQLEEELARTEALIGLWQRVLQDYMKDMSKIPALAELMGLDITTPQGRAQAEQIIRSLWEQITSGQLDPDALGVANMAEALEVLKTMEGLLDEIEADQGETQNVMRSVSITELQANQILAELSTQSTLQRMILGQVKSIAEVMAGTGTTAAVQAPPVPTPTMSDMSSDAFKDEFFRMLNELGAGRQNIDIHLQIGEMNLEGDAAIQAEQFTEQVMEDLRRKLGEELRNQERRYGLDAYRRR